MRIVQGKKYCTNCINCNTGWKCHVNRLANIFAESGAEAGLLLLEYGLGVRIDRVLYTLGLSGSDFTCSMQFWSSLIVTLMRRANWSKPSTPRSAKDFLAALPLFLSTAENCSSQNLYGEYGEVTSIKSAARVLSTYRAGAFTTVLAPYGSRIRRRS